MRNNNDADDALETEWWSCTYCPVKGKAVLGDGIIAKRVHEKACKKNPANKQSDNRRES